MKVYNNDGTVTPLHCSVCGKSTEKTEFWYYEKRLGLWGGDVAHSSCIAQCLRAYRALDKICDEICTKLITEGIGMKSYSTKGEIVWLKCWLCGNTNNEAPTVLFDGRPAHESCVLTHLKVWDDNDPENPYYAIVHFEVRNALAKKNKLYLLKAPVSVVFYAGIDKKTEVDVVGFISRQDAITRINEKLKDHDDCRIEQIYGREGDRIVELGFEVKHTVEVDIHA